MVSLVEHLDLVPALLAAPACIISSIVAKSCCVFLSFPCWKACFRSCTVVTLSVVEKGPKDSHRHENIFLLSICGAGFIGPAFLACIFRAAQPSNTSLLEKWDGDYLGDNRDGSEVGVSRIAYTMCVIFFATGRVFWFGLSPEESAAS